MIYKRNKYRVEISGDPKDTKWPMWFDLISSRLFWLVVFIILLIIVPKASIIPVVWQWIKKKFSFMILFMMVAPWWQMLFSG